jgi:glycosyltransferase involved in cell wall biosynthesis
VAERLVVITPWFPTEEEPGHGSFVAAAVAAVAHGRGTDVPVVHLRTVPPQPGAGVTVSREEHPYGPLVRISVPTEPLQSRLLTSRAMGEALAAHLPPELRDADVVHVHTGVPTGVAVLPVLAEHQRVVLTEHASYLQRVFADPDTKRAYVEALRRCALVLPVSDALGRSIAGVVPELGDRVVTVSNPVPMGSIPARQEHPERLDDWLVVSGLIARKNVDRLLEVFALWRAERPEAVLTVIGDGPDRAALEEQTTRLGLDGAVTFRGNIPHAEVLAEYHRHTLFMHLSAHETFGVVLAEAVAAGLCVVSVGGAAQREVLREAAALEVAALVQLDEPDEAILDAVRTMERTGRDADHVRAAQYVSDRFAPERIAEALESAYRGERPTRPVGNALRIAVLADPYSRKAPAMIRSIHRGSAAGASVVLVTRRGATWRGLPPGMEVVGLAGSLRWAYRATRVALAAGRIPFVLLTRVPLAGRRARPALIAYDAAARQVRRVVEGVLNQVLVPFLRGRALHRQIDGWAEGIDLIVADGLQWGPTAWRLARLNPKAEVRTSVSGKHLRELLSAWLRAA